MTNEEARNILLTSVHPQTAEEAEALGIAVKAIERMIPKKPTKMEAKFEQVAYGVETRIIDTFCPRCAAKIGLKTAWHYDATDETFCDVSVLNERNNDICGNCGQAIDWSEEE